MTDAIDFVALGEEGLPLTSRQRFLLEAMNTDAAENDMLPRSSREAEPLLVKIDVRGALDTDRLKSALSTTIATHEGLRTSFHTAVGFRSPRQSVTPPETLTPMSFDEVDLRGVEEGQRRLVEELREDCSIPFDLESCGLIKAKLFRLSDRFSVLALLVSPLTCDRLSLELIYRCIASNYAGQEEASLNASADEGLTYSQFVEWRHELECGEDAADGRAYWQGLGLGELARPQLPYRATDPEKASVGKKRCELRKAIDVSILNELTACSVSPDTTLQAVWWLLLARVSGQSDFIAGWQHDCRSDYDVFEKTVGTLDDVFPIAAHIDENETLAQFFARFDTMLEDHRSAQEFWSPDVVTNHASPSIGFATRDLPPTLKEHGPRWDLTETPGPFSRFELALDIGVSEEVPDEAVLHYDPDLYSQASAECLLEQYLTALAAVSDHLHKPVVDLPMVSAAERERCLALNETAVAPKSATVVEQFSLWVKRQPDVVALRDGDDTWSYARLDEEIEYVARHLRRLGVEAESRVGLLMPRSAQLVIALMAVLRAGGSYVPLDPAWPESRRNGILSNAVIPFVLTSGSLEPVQAVEGVTFLDVSDWIEGGAVVNAANQNLPELSDAATARQSAYVLYTSGSTGEPKGVVIEHGQLANYVEAVSDALELQTCENFALTSSVAADLGNTTLFAGFANGGCLVIADEETMLEGASFAKFLQEQAIDCVKIVPSHLAALLDGISSNRTLPHTLVLGGEPTPWALIDRVHSLDPTCRIYNHYGPTETTVGVMVHRIDPNERRQGHTPMLDRVLANCRIYILDAERRLAPVGAIGELYIGGAQICRGYLGQADELVIMEDPFVPGGRLYRSGDRARRLPDGRVQILGRTDEQLKIRGFRIEPAEIEKVFLSAPDVRQVAIKCWGEGEKSRIVAYIVLEAADEAHHFDEHALMAFARERLTEAMLPASVQILNKFPRLANGKIDRHSLPEPGVETARKSYVAPRDIVETAIADLVAQLLEQPKVSVEESFFDLGGHSLLVIKLVARLRKLFQIEIEPGIVFDHPSIAALTQALRDLETTPGRLEKVLALRQRISEMSEEQRSELLKKNTSVDDGKVA